jgi:hypothetical protein
VKPSRRKMIRLVLSHAGMAATGLGLLLSATMVTGSPAAQAESEAVTTDALVRVAHTDGQPLNMRAGPSTDQPIVARLAPDEVVTILGSAQVVGLTRWLPVRNVSNQVGWISDQYVTGVSPAQPVQAIQQAPSTQPAQVIQPAPSPSPELALATPPELAVVEEPAPPPPLPTPPLPSPVPLTSAQEATSIQAEPQPGGSLDVEAKVKYPEAKGRHQEITIWVTRAGAPVSGATVTIFTENDEDEPVRTLEPTKEDGRTWREFAIGKEKGGIELVVSAVAPDGGKGRTSVSYFRR